jgi:hypothetical protein
LSKVPADTTRNLGEWHLLSVDAAGTRPLTYQWSLNGNPIPGATARVHKAINFQTNNTGDFYSCAVTNPHGFAVTTNATFTVVDDPPANPTNGLVNYWPLDVFDANTNSPELHFGHSMQMVNMNTNFDIVPGQFSNSVFFFGSPAPGTYGYRTSGSPIYNRTNYTVSLWVNSSLLQNDRRIFSEGRDGGNNSPLFTLGTDNTGVTASFVPFVRPDAGAGPPINARLSTRPVFDGNWHHVVWTDENGKGKLYVDGNLDETDYTYRRPTNITLNITYIGVTARTTAANVPAPVTPYTGIIDEVATWDRVLTWSEIQMVMTDGVPVPTEVVLPPVITAQPPQRTNGVFVGDEVTFPVQVDGTPPFSFEWRKDGTPISGGVNPSALTDTLSLPNVQSADSNTAYTVVVSNPAGSVTSIVALLYVDTFAPITSGEVLNMDVGLSGSPNPQPGFAEFTLAQNPASFANGLRVTITGVGAPLAERNRVTGNMAANNPPDMTQAQIYNDFIFANNGTGDGTGMSVLVERLATNTAYGVTIWSFDPQSAGTRVSDWTETSSGAPIPIVTDHTFDGRILPTNNFQYTFGGLLTSSASGTLQFEGLRKPTSVGTDGVTPSFGVFINALRLVANPVATGVTRGAVVNGNLRLTTETEYPGMTPNIEQTTDLVSGPWVPAVGGSIIESVGPVVVVEFPISSTENLFYRGKRQP